MCIRLSIVSMVQTNRFGVYSISLYSMPLFSILYSHVGFGVFLITVYNDISLPSSLHCTRIVEYLCYITLGENILGNSQNGVDFSGLTKHYFYAIIETSFNCSSII